MPCKFEWVLGLPTTYPRKSHFFSSPVQTAPKRARKPVLPQDTPEEARGESVQQKELMPQKAVGRGPKTRAEEQSKQRQEA